MKLKWVAIILTIAGLSILIGTCVGGYQSPGGSTSPDTSQPEPDQPNISLKLLSKNYEREWGYLTVTGQVKNTGDIALDNVVASVSYYDSGGNFVKSDDALIAYNPILTGQTSPFEVITSDNPAITSYRVGFKFLLGGSIPTT